MADDRLGYVVVTYNQASHQPGLDFPDLHSDLEDAEAERDRKREGTYRCGRRERHVIAEVTEVPEPEKEPAGEPCQGFRWIGQTFSSCDRCGRPAPEHPGMERLREGVALTDIFGPEEDVFEVRPWPDEVLSSWRRRGLIPAAEAQGAPDA